jgi:hypothetical protein
MLAMGKFLDSPFQLFLVQKDKFFRKKTEKFRTFWNIPNSIGNY